MKRKSISAISIATFMLLSSNSFAGGYFGGSIGKSNPDGSEFKDDTSIKIFGGYQYSKYLALEATYVDLGEFDADRDALNQISNLSGFTVDSVSIEISGFEFSVLGFLPVTDNVSIFGRVGIFSWEADMNVSLAGLGSGTEDDDGNDAVFGLGLNFNVSDGVNLKAEFDRYDAFDGDVDYFGASVAINF